MGERNSSYPVLENFDGFFVVGGDEDYGFVAVAVGFARENTDYPPFCGGLEREFLVPSAGVPSKSD